MSAAKWQRRVTAFSKHDTHPSAEYAIMTQERALLQRMLDELKVSLPHIAWLCLTLSILSPVFACTHLTPCLGQVQFDQAMAREQRAIGECQRCGWS